MMSMENFDNFTHKDWEQYFRKKEQYFKRLADAVADEFRLDGTGGTDAGKPPSQYPPPWLSVTTTKPHEEKPETVFFRTQASGKTLSASDIRTAVAAKAIRLGALAVRLGTSKDAIRKLSKSPDSGFVIKSRGWVTIPKPQ